MPELTREQIDRLLNGEEIVVETEVWHHDEHGDETYSMMEPVVLTMAEDEEE